MRTPDTDTAGGGDPGELSRADLASVIDRALAARTAQLERQVAARDRRLDELAATVDPLAVDVDVAGRLGDVLREASERTRPMARRVRDQLDELERAIDAGHADTAASARANARRWLDELDHVHERIRRLTRAVAPRSSPKLSAAASREADRRLRDAVPLEDDLSD